VLFARNENLDSITKTYNLVTRHRVLIISLSVKGEFQEVAIFKTQTLNFRGEKEVKKLEKEKRLPQPTTNSWQNEIYDQQLFFQIFL
jgi:hypothetical protein